MWYSLAAEPVLGIRRRCFNAAVIVSLLCVTHSRAQGQPVHVVCSADLLCVEVYKSTRVELVLINHTTKPLSFRLFLNGEGASDDQPVIRLSQPGRRTLLSFTNSGKPWGFEFRIHYGHDSHIHDDDHLYSLPFAPGAAYEVSQSHTNLSTHHMGNRYAIDFSMPVGSPVHAARGGLVVSTYADSDRQGVDGEATANHIWIEHSDGTIGKYLHLKQGGVLVREGERVQSGDEIGLSGNTGFSSGAHLHFSVSTLGGEWLYEAFNVTFDTTAGPTRLVSGKRYQRPEQGRPPMPM